MDTHSRINLDIGGTTLPGTHAGRTSRGRWERRRSCNGGRRYFFIGGAALAVVGSIICATAKNIPTLIGGNVLLGIATATQMSYHFVFGELVPLKYRYTATACIMPFCFAGSGFGPIIVNALVTRFPASGWRSIYYLLLSYNVTALVLWTLFYFPPNFRVKHGNESKIQWLKNFDYVGTALISSGFVIFLFGISVGGTRYQWNSAPPIVMIILGFLTVCAFGFWEKFGKPAMPVAPPHIFRLQWVMVVVTLGLSAVVYYSTAIVWPQVINILYSNESALYRNCLACLPGIAGISGQMIGGPIVERTPRHRLQLTLAFLVGAVFVAACACVNLNNKGTIATFMFLGNFGMGWTEALCLANSTILIHDQQEIGVAGSMAASIRTAISAVGAVVLGTVFSNGLATKIPAAVGPAVLDAGLPLSSLPAFLQALSLGQPDAFAKVPGATSAIIADGMQAYKVGTVNAARVVFYVSIAFGATGVLTSLFTPDTDRMLNDKVAATLHGERGTLGDSHPVTPSPDDLEIVK